MANENDLVTEKEVDQQSEEFRSLKSDDSSVATNEALVATNEALVATEPNTSFILPQSVQQKITQFGEDHKTAIRNIPIGIGIATLLIVGHRRFWFRRWSSLGELPLPVLRGDLYFSARIRSIESDGVLCVQHTPGPPLLRRVDPAVGMLFVRLAGLEHTPASVEEIRRNLQPNQRVTLQVLQITDSSSIASCRLWSWWLWPVCWQASLADRLVRLGLVKVDARKAARANSYALPYLLQLVHLEASAARKRSRLWRRALKTSACVLNWALQTLFRRPAQK